MRSKIVLLVAGIVLLLLVMLIPSFIAAGRTAETAGAGQGDGAPAPSATVSPATPTPAEEQASPAPSPSPVPFTFPAGSEIAGAGVGGLTAGAATERVAEALRAYERTVVLWTQGYSDTLRTTELLDLPAAEQLVDRSREGAGGTEPVTVPAEVTVDRPALQGIVERIAPMVDRPVETAVISDAEALTQTFTFARRPGLRLDVERSVSELAEAIASPAGPDRVELVVEPVSGEPLPMSELERVLREHAAYWNGVAGFYVHDLETGETLAYNADTVFSGASVMKVPIMIFAYARLGALDDQQRGWMHKMIVDSENLEANSLLAAAVGSQGTEAALQGVNEMSQMLRDLGLQHTYQLIPYESGEWLIQQAMLPGGGPIQEGEPPFTAADRYLRTTPREMGELFVMLDECARGTGPLLEKVRGHLDEALCDEMIDWLRQPHDPERMVAGLPPGTPVAHKGGWIDDMQSDVGIVDSPGGRYVAAIYIWRDGYVTDIHATPSPYLGDFSHTIYTFFNPVPLDEVRQEAAGE